MSATLTATESPALRVFGSDHAPATFDVPFRIHAPGDYRFRLWTEAEYHRLPPWLRPDPKETLVLAQPTGGPTMYCALERDGGTATEPPPPALPLPRTHNGPATPAQGRPGRSIRYHRNRSPGRAGIRSSASRQAADVSTVA